MSKRIIALLAALAALAMIVAGCGGGGDSTGSTEGSSSLTKAELIKQGDAICKKGEKTLEEETEAFVKENNVNTEKPTEAQKSEVIEQVVAPALRKQAEELRELGTPSGEEKQVEEIFDTLEKGTEEIEEDPSLLFEGGKNGVEEASQMAKKYGFKECGEE